MPKKGQENKEQKALREIEGVVDRCMTRLGLKGDTTEAKVARQLAAALAQATEQLEDILYREWPDGTSKALGLRPDWLHELVQNCKSALNTARRNKLWNG